MNRAIPIRIVFAMIVFGAVLTAFADPLRIGEEVPTFALREVRENALVSLEDFDDAKGVLILFIATQCPVSNDYNGRMASLAERYADRGVVVLGINSNRQEAVEEIRSHAEANGLDFPILKDTGNEVADAYGARVTPEAFLLQPSGSGAFRLRYHGTIDDSQDVAKVQSRPLETAIEALLAGEPIRRPETKPFGSTIKRVRRRAGDANR